MKWTLADIWGILGFILMMAGIVGLSWEVFREGGWGGQMLGATWGAVTSKPFVIIPMVLIAGGIAYLLTRGQVKKGGNPFSNALVYGLMALGVFFIFRALT